MSNLYSCTARIHRVILELFRWHLCINVNALLSVITVSGWPRIYTVSYTHLDVYKRQMLYNVIQGVGRPAMRVDGNAEITGVLYLSLIHI